MKTTRFLCGVAPVALACAVGAMACGGAGDEAAPSEDSDSTELGASARISWCGSNWNQAPADFWPTLNNAAQYMVHVPDFWGQKSTDQGKCMSKIACYESNWEVHATNNDYRGMYQIDVDKFPMAECTYNKYWNGGPDASGQPHEIRFWQHYAAFRYVLSRYANPCDGWAHEVKFGWW